MSPQGRPKREYRSAQREGNPINPQCDTKGNSGARSAKVIR